MQLTTGQHGFQQVTGVHGALGLARTDNGVQLVDKQDNTALGLLDLAENGFQPLLKLTTVFCTGNQRAHIQGKNGLVLQGGGHVAFDNPLGQALGNGCFTYAGFTDQDGVILTFPAQNPDDISDFVVSADDRVQLVLPGTLHQIGAVFLQCVVGLLRVVAGDPLVAADGLQRFQTVLPVDLVRLEQGPQHVVRMVQHGQEQVFHRDKLILHLIGQMLGGLEHIVHLPGNIIFIGFTAGTGDLGQPVNLLTDRCLQTFHRHAHLLQQLGNQTVFLLQQGQQQMALLNLLVGMLQGDGLSALDGFQGLFRIFLCIHKAMTFLSGGDYLLFLRLPSMYRRSPIDFSTLTCRVLTFVTTIYACFPSMSIGFSVDQLLYFCEQLFGSYICIDDFTLL